MIGLGLYYCQDPAAQPSGMSPSLNPDEFRNACALFANGVAVATVTAPDGTPHGLTVSSFTSVSIQPPLVLICIALSCTIITHFRTNAFFAVNVLSEQQRDLSVHFATRTEGRFEGIDWVPGVAGSPLLHDCLARFQCRTDQIVEAGDHIVLLGTVIKVESFPGDPLVYFNRSYRSLL
jgi:flavin reductase (DIM6/NTAB) family NADH-FMN oxidoreductase RutF